MRLKLFEARSWIIFKLNMNALLQKDPPEQIRCARCNKLVAKSFTHGHFEIKCPRCNTLNAVFEKMIRQVIITDSNGKILYINKATEKISGYNIGEAIGNKPSKLWGNQMPEKFYEKMWKVIKNKKPFTAIITNKQKSGRLYDVEMIISPVSDTSGNNVFYIGIETATKNNMGT